MPPKIKPTTTTATGSPISYQQMAAHLQAAYPRRNAPIYGLDDVDDDVDGWVVEHVPGIECVDNPFCEECYK